MIPFLEALLLFGVYAVGYPWFAPWLYLRLPETRGRWAMEEAASLLLVILLVAILDRGSVRAILRPRKYRTENSGPMLRIAWGSLFFLGLLALVFRLIDPAFDEREFALRGLSTPGALGELFAMLPFGVASEELVFRFCQRRLRRALAPAPAILAVSLAFSLFHRVPGTALDRHEVETLLGTLAGGAVLALAYERAASLPLLIAIHLGYDFLGVAQGWLNVQRWRMAEAGLFLLWIGIAGAGAWWFRRARASGPDEALLWGDSAARQKPCHPAVRWSASLMFGAAFPLLLAWIRIRLGL